MVGGIFSCGLLELQKPVRFFANGLTLFLIGAVIGNILQNLNAAFFGDFLCALQAVRLADAFRLMRIHTEHDRIANLRGDFEKAHSHRRRACF